MAKQASLGKRTAHLGRGTVVSLSLSMGSGSTLEDIAQQGDNILLDPSGE